MYIVTLRHLLRRRRNRESWKFFFCYSTGLLLLLTMDISVNAVWGEQMWITFRDAPGGVPLFIATQLSNWYQAWGSSAAVALVFMSDGLLVSTAFNPLLLELIFMIADLPPVHHLWLELPGHHRAHHGVHRGVR